MGTKPETEILNILLDNYEKSKSFTGTNKNTQTFKVSIGSLFPRYLDHAEFEYYTKLNASVAFLLSKDFVSAPWPFYCRRISFRLQRKKAVK